MMQYKIIPVTAFQQNCTLFWCDETREAVVVDPGGDIDLILAQVNDLGITLTKILLTHAHLDHAGASAELVEKLSITIEGPHKEDQFWIDLFPEQIAQFGFKPVNRFEPDRWLDQGDKVTFGNITLDVYFCPGHTPGHVIFYHKDSQLAQVGDVLFDGSIGRTDFPKGCQTTLINSIKENLWPLGNDVQFIPGHGPMSTFGDQRRSNPYVRD
ncbi:Glyoxylase, beta-lactamase superfamily II [Pseudoalteromonas denitrificans DSM 6059]|uniref:Glyoxylase, beta-lactamase superfamily II n=2 Tax=Pseudoalteromonas TaxID=53246 RepID=A0A1I1KTS8_9GAMM|nr:Glyoxylase, beta-lactamase superfamily II [Pseudoalteromonas denitrificans DSM 6059]